MRYAVAIAVVLWSGVVWGERLQRVDFSIDYDGTPTRAWLFLDPDIITPMMPSINGLLHSEIYLNGFGSQSLILRDTDQCNTYSDSWGPHWTICGLDFDGLPTYDLPQPFGSGYKLGDAVSRLASMQSSYVSSGWRSAILPFPHNWTSIDSNPLPRNFDVTYVGTEIYDVIGDINKDGSTDASDAAQLFGEWGSPDIYTGGRLIDAGSAGVLFANWTGDVVAVPEPNASCLLGICAYYLRRAVAKLHF